MKRAADRKKFREDLLITHSLPIVYTWERLEEEESPFFTGTGHMQQVITAAAVTGYQASDLHFLFILLTTSSLYPSSHPSIP